MKTSIDQHFTTYFVISVKSVVYWTYNIEGKCTIEKDILYSLFKITEFLHFPLLGVKKIYHWKG